MAGEGCAAAAGQQVEAVVQALGDLAEGEHAGPGLRPARWRAGCRRAGGTSRRRPPALRGVDLEAGLRPPGRARQAGARPRLPVSACGRLAAGVGQASERRRARDSPAMPQRLAAGGQDAQARARPEQRVGQLGAGVDQVLAVVQHQEQRTTAQVGRHRFRRPAGPGARHRVPRRPRTSARPARGRPPARPRPRRRGRPAVAGGRDG